MARLATFTAITVPSATICNSADSSKPCSTKKDVSCGNCVSRVVGGRGLLPVRLVTPGQLLNLDQYCLSASATPTVLHHATRSTRR